MGALRRRRDTGKGMEIMFVWLAWWSMVVLGLELVVTLIRRMATRAADL